MYKYSGNKFIFFVNMLENKIKVALLCELDHLSDVFLCRFAAGDVVMMYPCNAPEDVQQFCQLLRLDPEATFTLKATNNDAGRGMRVLSCSNIVHLHT